MNEEQAKALTDSALRFLREFPCLACLRFGNDHSCAEGYTHRDRCPVWHGIRDNLKGRTTP